MKTFKQFNEFIDLKKLGHSQDPAAHTPFIVVGSAGNVKDLVIFRGSKDEAEKFLKNPNNAYRISKRWRKVYKSRQLEVGDKFNPKYQTKYDKWKDIVHLQAPSF
jgi:hypothetical protein